ncbi:MAG TPA: tetratricopeptide repeat protein [Blastocatellia bacterium]|nr:tetratricopeptide repeat protein [Blastocatellia bacterium]
MITRHRTHNLSNNLRRRIVWTLAECVAITPLVFASAQHSYLTAAARLRAHHPQTEVAASLDARPRSPLNLAAQTVLSQTSVQQTVEAGVRLQAQGTAESLRQAIAKYEEARRLYRDLGDTRGEAVMLNNIGLAYHSLGEEQKAIDFFRQALPLLQAVGDRREETTLLINIGGAYAAAQELPKALDSYRQAQLFAQATGDRAGEAAAISGIGSVYYALKEIQKAIDFSRQAAALWQAAGDRQQEAIALSNVGAFYVMLREESKALDFYRQSIPLFQASGDQGGQAAAVYTIGKILLARGAQQEALEAYHQASLLWRAIDDRFLEAVALNHIGEIHRAAGQRQKALDAHLQALKSWRGLENRAEEARTLNAIGLIYASLGDRQRAADYHSQAVRLRGMGRPPNQPAPSQVSGPASNATTTQQKLANLEQALTRAREKKDRDMEAQMLINIGWLHHQTGAKEKALDYSSQGLAVARGAEDKRREAIALNNLGLIYSVLGERQKALVHLNQALALFRKLDNRPEEANTLNNLGAAYRSQGSKQKAIEYYLMSLDISQNAGDLRKAGIALNDIGLIHQSSGEKQKALEHYQRAVSFFRTRGDKREEANTLTNISHVYHQLEEPRQALFFLSQALSLWRETGESCRVVNALADIGRTYASLGEQQNALDSCRQALLLLQTAGDRNRMQEAALLNTIAQLYDSLGEKQKALDSYQEALPLWREIGNPRGQASILHGISKIYASLGDEQKASDYLNQALALGMPLTAITQTPSSIPSLPNNALLITFSNDESVRQKEFGKLHQWLMDLRSAGDRAGEARTLRSIGNLHFSSGEQQQALDYYRQALAILRIEGDRSGEASTHRDLARTYRSLGDKQQALEVYRQAAELFRASGDRVEEARTLGLIGDAHSSSGEKQQALEYYLQAAALFQAAGDNRAAIVAIERVAAAYDSLGETRKVIEAYEQAIPLWRKLAGRVGMAKTLNLIGAGYEKLGEKPRAREYHEQARSIWNVVGDPGGESATLYRLALLDREFGALSEARSEIEAALQLIESVRANVYSQELRASYLARNRDYYELYIDLLMRLHQRRPSEGFNGLALQASERARARSLLEILSEAKADIRQGVDPALLKRQMDLQRSLNAKAATQTELLLGEPTQEQLTTVKREIEALTAELQAVESQIRQSSPRYAALTQPVPLTLAEIQHQTLDPETLLLEYALGEERSYLWAVTPTSITSYELPKRAEIESAARRVYDSLTARHQISAESGIQPQPAPAPQTETRRKDELTQSAQREIGLAVKTDQQYPEAAATLSRMLLGPVAELARKKRLLIVAEGALQYVPFVALPDPQTLTGGRDNGQPLVVSYEIVNLPSASTLAVLRRETAGRRPAAKSLAILADPVFDKEDERVKPAAVGEKAGAPAANPDGERILKHVSKKLGGDSVARRIPRLPYTRLEAERISALVPDAGRKQALDFAASRATIASAELSQYRFVHIATHGLADSERPELSTIVLSLVDERGAPQDGFLRAHEVYNLKLPADVVTLSACETGLGKDIKGEGLVGLARGFMYAGAPRVVVSLWSVSDIATAELMVKFYRKMLSEGQRPAAALQAAQIEMLKDKRWEAPYYWAAFGLQGEWR